MLSNSNTAATLPARDLDRARRFYREKLGLTPVMERPDGLYYGSGCAMFSVYPSEYAGTAKNTAMGWITENLDQEMAELRAKGVKFEEYDMGALKTVKGVAEIEGNRGCWFKDSEGNILALFEMKEPLPGM